MKKYTIIQENIFTTIAKMIAALQIEKKVGAAMNQLSNDEEVVAAMNQLRQSAKNTTKILKDYCKVHPNDPKCKDSGDK